MAKRKVADRPPRPLIFGQDKLCPDCGGRRTVSRLVKGFWRKFVCEACSGTGVSLAAV